MYLDKLDPADDSLSLPFVAIAGTVVFARWCFPRRHTLWFARGLLSDLRLESS
ncbi:MAG: hypothetical protein R3A48_04805 [Polyangiales bacterium]